MICGQSVVRPGTSDGDFHHLDGQTAHHARSLPGVISAETWQQPGSGPVNATAYLAGPEPGAHLATFPIHPEGKGRAPRRYDGYRIINAVTSRYADGGRLQ